MSDEADRKAFEDFCANLWKNPPEEPVCAYSLRIGYLAGIKRGEERLVKEFSERLKLIPEGHENNGFGKSTYNWGQHYLRVLQSIAQGDVWPKRKH